MDSPLPFQRAPAAEETDALAGKSPILWQEEENPARKSIRMALCYAFNLVTICNEARESETGSKDSIFPFVERSKNL